MIGDVVGREFGKLLEGTEDLKEESDGRRCSFVTEVLINSPSPDFIAHSLFMKHCHKLMRLRFLHYQEDHLDLQNRIYGTKLADCIAWR